jgi:hypothetical protein
MRPRVITWPAPSATSISVLQTLGLAGNLLLNGSLNTSGKYTSHVTYPGSLGIPLITFPGYTRTITLTSTNDLSGDNFTIVGMLNNSEISEVLAGPNNTTVTSVNAYDSIISITANAAVAAVSAGTGTTGRTAWISFDYDMLVANYSVQGVVTATTINYTLFLTLDDPNVVATPTVFSPITALTGATTSQFASLTNPINYMNITINSSNTTGALVATFLQQGIAS